MKGNRPDLVCMQSVSSTYLEIVLLSEWSPKFRTMRYTRVRQEWRVIKKTRSHRKRRILLSRSNSTSSANVSRGGTVVHKEPREIENFLRSWKIVILPTERLKGCSPISTVFNAPSCVSTIHPFFFFFLFLFLFKRIVFFSFSLTKEYSISLFFFFY